ncbi:hypothetical protein QFC21_006527 [Naganishia friedmannii]|uniref:Uncharacterized protein n=1 Tax=Naganishia friedmannii TaxID=89922 RepID=A0ACC2V2Q1_9TREE|nr:hypothetical protein QFC21_006527 [Naganishia friedmannii]
MTTVAKSTLADRYPEEFPDWASVLIEGLNYLELGFCRTPHDKSQDASAAQVAEGYRSRRVSTSSSVSECSRMDWEGCSVKASVDSVEGEDEDARTSMQKAESSFAMMLRQAIRLSDGKEPLPYTWLAFCQIRSDRWSEAYRTLSDGPPRKDVLFGLSLCYEQESQYGNAYDTLKRAIQLTPPEERVPYDVHRARLAELVKCENENTSRCDPFELLPLEQIVLIMEFGQTMDDHFVLKSGWMNRRWRHTLAEQCPELWRTVTISSLNANKRASFMKARTWRIRSGDRVCSLCFENFGETAMNNLPRLYYRKYLEDIKHLTVSVTDESTLRRFTEEFGLHLGKLESLKLEVAPGTVVSALGEIRTPESSLWGTHSEDLCFLAIPRSHRGMRESLKTLEIQNVSFERLPPVFGAELYPTGFAMRTRYLDTSVAFTYWYPVLKRLIVRQSLRTAPLLEHLEVVPTWNGDGRPASPGFGKRITMSHLENAILPPPSLWSIDITAPNLTSLIFKSPFLFCGQSYIRHDQGRRTPLIPRIEESPIPLEALPNLQNVEFVCFDNDLESRLQDWLLYLTNVKTMTIRYLEGDSWPSPPATIGRPDTRVSIKVVQIFTDHPEWCPNLQKLELERCFATGDSLVQLVRARKRSSLCVALNQLIIKANLDLGTEARTILRQELPIFHKGDPGIIGESLPQQQRMEDDLQDVVSALTI